MAFLKKIVTVKDNDKLRLSMNIHKFYIAGILCHCKKSLYILDDTGKGNIRIDRRYILGCLYNCGIYYRNDGKFVKTPENQGYSDVLTLSIDYTLV